MKLSSVRNLLSSGKSIYDIPLRVTFYSRVSTEHEEQVSSLKNQIDYFKELIESNINWTYITGYVDQGITGTVDSKRYNFMNMIRDAKAGLFDLILTKEISRFSRNTLDSIKYTRELINYGVSVYFLNDNINTSDLDSELRLTIMASLAQDEVRRLSERVKFGMKRAIKNGHILGNDLLYGYNKVNNSLFINKEEADKVRRLFVMYGIKKLSLHSIANIFNKEGIKTSLNKPFSVTTLSRMIRNPKYKGYYCGGKSEVVDYMTKRVEKFDKTKWVMYEDNVHIPPIVSEDLFDLANKRLDLVSKGTKVKIIKYPLSSKIICDLCGNALHKRKMSKNKDEIVWFCKNHKTNIRESEILYIIKDIMELDYKYVESLLIDNYKKFNTTDSLKQEIDDIKIRKEKLFALISEDCISNLEFKEKNDYYNQELKRLKEKQQNSSYNKEYLSEFINDYFSQNEFVNNLISLAIDKINIKYIDENHVNLFIRTNIKDIKGKHVNSEFKRGYDVVGTRRYIFKVSVYLN